LKIHRIFYGWYIVIALFLIWTAVHGTVVSGFTSFIEPIINRFGWNYIQVSFAASLRDLVLVIFMPIAGFLVDRFSARKLIFTGIISTGLGLFFIGRITSLSHLYLCFLLIGIGCSTTTATIPLTIIGRWFKKKVSLVTGIVMAGAGAAGLYVPLVTEVIDRFEWKFAMLVLGMGFWIIISPLSFLVRQNPEQYGYLPDGELNNEPIQKEGFSTGNNGTDSGVKKSLKSRAFWHISLAFALHSLIGSATMTYIMPYLSAIGIARMTSSYLAMAMSVMSIFGRLGLGWAGDKFDKRKVASTGTLTVGLGLLIFSCFTSMTTWSTLLAVTLLGIGWGGGITLHSVILREYFGTGNLGTIIGISVGITAVGLMAAPPLVSWILESTGSYRIVWIVLIGVVILSVTSQLTNRPFKTAE
jgi:MFS family permease